MVESKYRPVCRLVDWETAVVDTVQTSQKGQWSALKTCPKTPLKALIGGQRRVVPRLDKFGTMGLGLGPGGAVSPSDQRD